MENIKVNSILFFFLGLLLFSNCADVELEENPPSTVDLKTFFTTDSEFQAALAGTFLSLYQGWEGFDYAYPLILTSGGEDVMSTAGIFLNLDRLSANDGDQSIEAVWRRFYKAIANANLIIGNLENAKEVSEDRLNAIEGQAKFVRAFCFFYLVRWFGEIQLTTIDHIADVDNLRQASVTEIYASIIENLKDAETKLPVSFPDEKGRPTQGAAKALLAKVYLTMAGWPLEDASYYALARDKAAEVMALGYDLEPNFADLWKQENRLTNTEFIFAFYGSIANDGVAASHMHTASMHPIDGGWGDFHSEERFYDAFPEGPRKEASFTTVFSNGSTYQDEKVPPFIAKYRDAGTLINDDLEGEGFNVLIRYADVLLMYAEAANMAEGGPSGEALEALNKVRRRAMGLDINTPDALVDFPAGASQSDFDEAVIAERNWELAFEMNRWFDLVRKKMVVQVNQNEHPGVKENNRLLPKPGAQLIPGFLEQNSGY